MKSYIVKRLAWTIPTLLGAMTLVFVAIRLAPGDPANLFVPPDISSDVHEEVIQEIRRLHGFDQPLHVQYVSFIIRSARLDFGRSLRFRTLVSEDLLRRLPNTLQLGVLSLFIATVLGIGFGVISAVRRHSSWDNAVMFAALFGVSMPSFWFALVLMVVFGLYLPILPISGYGGPLYTWVGFRHMLLPAVAMGLSGAGGLARYTRSSMMSVINEDYIRTARSKGLSERAVIYKHALRNALIPVVTVIGLMFGGIFGGSVIIETVFGWPGVGRYLISGIGSRDFPSIQGGVLVLALGFVAANFATDLLYGFIDPRIRYE